MELESLVTAMNLLTLFFSTGSVYSVPVGHDNDLQSPLVQRLDDIQSQLLDITNSMRALDNDISKTLVHCLEKHSNLCEAFGEELKTLVGLSSGWDLDVAKDSQVDRYRSLLRELGRKRTMVNHLLGVFRGAHDVLKQERKRTCNLNLGFHCQTEEISNFADMYDYLSSAKSPGKKRSVRSSP